MLTDSRTIYTPVHTSMWNPNLESELTNAFTQRRKQESSFRIVSFLIVHLRRLRKQGALQKKGSHEDFQDARSTHHRGAHTGDGPVAQMVAVDGRRG